MRPLIAYPGGKQRMIPNLLPVISGIPHSIYVAPFAGGEALLFAKPRHYGASDLYREVINDVDKLLINLYQVARDCPEALNRRLQLTLYSQAEHQAACRVLRQPSLYSKLDRAWAYIIGTQQGFAHKHNAGWAAGRKSENHARTWTSKQLQFPPQLERLKSVFISCEDALDCIARWDSSDTLFVCDPPYPGTDQDGYAGKYSEADWRKLCETLDQVQGSWVLCGDGQFAGPATTKQLLEFDAVCSASSERYARTEVAWICDRLVSTNRTTRISQISLPI
jgi:DNA adenine methylase